MKPFAVFSICMFIAVSTGLSISHAVQYDPIIYQAQKALKARGYDPGVPDGLWGKATERAVKYFQVDNELPVTGKLDEQTKAKLDVGSVSRTVEAVGSSQERRTALVIGNGDYRNISPLKNPVSDARDMAAALKDLGFEVVHKENANQKSMEQAVVRFSRSLRKGGVGMFYYAGHGVQVNGRNYLLPIGADINTEFDVKYEAVDMGRILDGMYDAGNGLNIVMLDACRNNPFARSFRSADRGLARMDAPTGTFIAYATAPGSVAADGEGRNGTFTKHLLKNMRTSGLTIERVLKLTRNGVMSETGNQQVPWQSSSLTGDFYFASSGAVVTRPAETPSGSAIEISANVSGARVLVDGRGVGTTPVSGVSVAPGSHRIRVEKEGYEPYEKQVRVEAGRTFSMQVYLDRTKSKKGRLYVDTDPKDARVNIPGIGRVYPGIELEPGQYRVEASASGYEPRALSVTVEAGEDRSISIRLSRIEPTDPPRFTNSLGMEFVKIPAGSFMMGSALSADAVARKFGGKAEYYKDEHPLHRVTLTKPFYMQATEVTVGQWRAFVRDTGYKTEAETGGGAYIYTGKKWEKKEGYYWDNPGFSQTDDHPVTCVSWNDVHAYTKWLSRKEGKTYRLPTEAEWEYACRAGSTTPFYYGNDKVRLGDYAWYWDNSGKRTHAVSGKKPNLWGLYDMHGNVWEWCLDWYGDYPTGAVTDPEGPSSGAFRVIRGGSFVNEARRCRSAIRANFRPGVRFNFLGFRLSRSVALGP